MKKFIELIQRIHQERYSVVMQKIISQKIPVAFLSVAPIQNSVATVKNLRAQGVNITNLVSATPPQ